MVLDLGSLVSKAHKNPTSATCRVLFKDVFYDKVFYHEFKLDLVHG